MPTTVIKVGHFLREFFCEKREDPEILDQSPSREIQSGGVGEWGGVEE